jgi:hypothetical protein
VQKIERITLGCVIVQFTGMVLFRLLPEKSLIAQWAVVLITGFAPAIIGVRVVWTNKYSVSRSAVGKANRAEQGAAADRGNAD